MFEQSRWYSESMGREARLVRWGHWGQPVLVFPTAGGDAEEIARFHLVGSVMPLIEAGRVKLYSCDSVAGQVWFAREGSPHFRMWMQNRFHQYIRHEVVPAIHMDCRGEGIPVWAAGASIGAFHAVAVTCRFPDLFHRALGMSGTYDLMRFIEVDAPSEDFLVCSPPRPRVAPPSARSRAGSASMPECSCRPATAAGWRGSAAMSPVRRWPPSA
jgi:esterase/lipase superfamily enzyme